MIAILLDILSNMASCPVFLSTIISYKDIFTFSPNQLLLNECGSQSYNSLFDDLWSVHQFFRFFIMLAYQTAFVLSTRRSVAHTYSAIRDSEIVEKLSASARLPRAGFRRTYSSFCHKKEDLFRSSFSRRRRDLKRTRVRKSSNSKEVWRCSFTCARFVQSN